MQIRLGSVFQSEITQQFPTPVHCGSTYVIEAPPRFDFAPHIGQRQEPMLVQALS